MSDYSWVETGIAIYRGRYRANIGAFGETYIENFDTLEEARAWRVEMRKIALGKRPVRDHAKTKKVSVDNADLPVGLSESRGRKLMADGRHKEYPYITANVVVHGVRIANVTRTYGISRTRYQAIKEVLAERDRLEELYAR